LVLSTFVCFSFVIHQALLVNPVSSIHGPEATNYRTQFNVAVDAARFRENRLCVVFICGDFMPRLGGRQAVFVLSCLVWEARVRFAERSLPEQGNRGKVGCRWPGRAIT
jgi:hypothetical protein